MSEAQKRFREKNKDNPDFKRKNAEAQAKFRATRTPEERERLRLEKNAYSLAHYHANRGKIAVQRLAREHNVSVAEIERIVAAHQGACQICNRPAPLFQGREGGVIDHCHKTGRIRGVLCQPCNTGLGLFKDDPNNLARAKRYLLG